MGRIQQKRDSFPEAALETEPLVMHRSVLVPCRRQSWGLGGDVNFPLGDLKKKIKILISRPSIGRLETGAVERRILFPPECSVAGGSALQA